MIWQASSNQTVFDLAIQLYGDVSFANKIVYDNNLLFSTMTTTGQEIYFDSVNIDLSLQTDLLDNNIIITTGFLSSTPALPPIIQRSFSNDFSLDFD